MDMNPKQLRRLMEQAAEMQAKMADAQQQVMDTVFEGSAGGGVVLAKVRGNGRLVSVVDARETRASARPERA